ncbi:hypothetical protein GYA13_05110 [Candidatus Kuenenbacteria bacterium]|nr:hypothetical protein [Candidatus Kuenenbacteria bacterium]
MLDSSKDLLFVVLAICAIAFTTFACWLIYYFIAIVKDVYSVTKGIKKKVDLLDDILKTIKEKINSTASYVGLIFNSVEKIVDYFQQKKTSSDRPASKKSAKVKMEE